MRPWLGLSPTSPQHDAGMRIEPPPSLACANGTMPLATAAAAPPLDPPGERVVSHGLWVAPQAIGSVVGTLPSSGLLVRPAITSPASRKRLDQRGVGVRDRTRVLQRDVAVGDALAGIAGEQVLDQERHAAKRAVGQRSSRGVAGVVEPADDHRVERGVDALDPLDGRFEQFERRHLTRCAPARPGRPHPSSGSDRRVRSRGLCSTQTRCQTSRRRVGERQRQVSGHPLGIAAHRRASKGPWPEQDSTDRRPASRCRRVR